MLRDICPKPVVTVTTEAPIGEAARLMHDKHVGGVVVVTGTRPGGIVTDRDLAIPVAAGGKPPGAPVGEIMRRNPDRGVPASSPSTTCSSRSGPGMGHVASARSRELGRPATVAAH
jgi:CBS domain-containing protein